jgi:hypothetical protein
MADAAPLPSVELSAALLPLDNFGGNNLGLPRGVYSNHIRVGNAADPNDSRVRFLPGWTVTEIARFFVRYFALGCVRRDGTDNVFWPLYADLFRYVLLISAANDAKVAFTTDDLSRAIDLLKWRADTCPSMFIKKRDPLKATVTDADKSRAFRLSREQDYGAYKTELGQPFVQTTGAGPKFGFTFDRSFYADDIISVVLNTLLCEHQPSILRQQNFDPNILDWLTLYVFLADTAAYISHGYSWAYENPLRVTEGKTFQGVVAYACPLLKEGRFRFIADRTTYAQDLAMAKTRAETGYAEAQ